MNKSSAGKIAISKATYILEATVEYLISISVTGSFLATLTELLGISDSLTGILSSVVSLGCLFQLLSISIRRTRVKNLVIFFSVINQLLFMLLYVVPLTNFQNKAKITLFVIFILSAYFIYNFIHPKKITWLVSTVNDGHLGRFTANKEIVSLLSGIVFSFGMGAVIDHFSSKNEIHIALIVSAVVIFILMVFHTLSLILAIEVNTHIPAQNDHKSTVRRLINNRNTLYITVIFLLYYVSTYISVPFYGTYQINELDLSLKDVSFIAICGSISRIAVSKHWGRYADKTSFATMLEKCLIFFGLSQLFVIFAVPSNGFIMFTLYSIINGISLGGINSALTNLVFEYLPPEGRADALAITQAFAGLTGFLATVCISPLVSYIQKSGDSVLGMSVYAQQIITVLSLAFTLIAIAYTRATLVKTKKVQQ